MSIKFDKRNYRKHGARNKELIRKSLSDLGAGRSVLIDADDSLIAGNGVYEQAQKLGIPVRVVETDGTELIAVKRTDVHEEDEKRKMLAFADNATSDSSEFDMDLITADFQPMELAEWDVTLPNLQGGGYLTILQAIRRQKRMTSTKRRTKYKPSARLATFGSWESIGLCAVTAHLLRRLQS